MKKVTLFRIITAVMILVDIASIGLTWVFISNQLPTMKVLLRIVMTAIFGTYFTYGYLKVLIFLIRTIEGDNISDIVDNNKKHYGDTKI